jgi:hypothetical protein
MLRYAATLLYAVSAVALGSVEPLEDLDKVNGSIVVEPGRRAGDASTVNGSITVGSDARLEDLGTVNGKVLVGPRAGLRNAETVNGSITLEESAVATGDLEAVNGGILLARGARVDGQLANVNGELRLEGASVGRGLSTVNGDVFVGAGSRVDGGIEVDKPGGWGWSPRKRLPRVTVESGAVVNGPLRFEREVELHVGATAVVGPVEGVAPQRHTLP